MRIRLFMLASVSAAFLAASAAASGVSAASSQNANTVLASEAYKALSSGDPAIAVEKYTKAIESRELEPEVLANALLNRGLSYQHLNRHEQAIEDYSAALRIDAMSGRLRAMALYNRGLSYQKIGKSAQAMEDYTSALFLDANFAHAYYSRAGLLRDTGQYLFALADYAKAAQTSYPDLARVYYGEALTFEAMNRPDEMRASLAKAVAANPSFEPASVKLASLQQAIPVAAAQLATETQTASVAQDLPKAQPPQLDQADDQLITASSTPVRKKKYVDRVPVEEEQPKAQVASAEPPAVEQPAPQPEEKVVAVEPVADVMPSAADDQTASITPAPAVAEETTSETPAAEQPKISGWAVQVASASSEEGAWSTWKKMQARYRVLADKTPTVVRADLGAKGTFFRVRFLGFDDQSSAQSACAKLKAKGVKCFVSKASA